MVKINAIVFDADGTLLETENPYLCIAKALEVEDIVKHWVREYLDNKMTYQELVDKETEIFISQYQKLYKRKPQIGDLEKYLPHTNLRSDTEEVLNYVSSKDLALYVLSSGFLYLIEDLTKLHIKLNHIHANRFLYDTKGDFIMIKIDVSGEKIDGYKGIVHGGHLTMPETAYVGDNAFDQKVMDYVLENNGTVFFLQNADKLFGIKTLPKNDRLITISKLHDLERYL